MVIHISQFGSPSPYLPLNVGATSGRIVMVKQVTHSFNMVKNENWSFTCSDYSKKSKALLSSQCKWQHLNQPNNNRLDVDDGLSVVVCRVLMAILIGATKCEEDCVI